MSKGTGCLTLLILVGFFVAIIGNIAKGPEIDVHTSKVLTIYPNKKTIAIYTDFNEMSIRKPYSKTRKFSKSEFNDRSNTSIYISEPTIDYSRKEFEITNKDLKIIDKKIYSIVYLKNGKIRVDDFNKKFDFYSVWDFNKNGYSKDFIFNKTEKDLYLEPIVYGSGLFTSKELKTIIIKPGEIISSWLPEYFFENEPPSSITTTLNYEITRYWLRH